MATRLTELLERIRPSGAPGAAADGARGAERGATDEIAAVAEFLVEFRRSAERTIADARDRADEILRSADRQAAEVTAGLEARIAEAEADATTGWPDPTLARIEHDCDEAIRSLDARAAAEMPRLVDRAVERIWLAITAEEPAP